MFPQLGVGGGMPRARKDKVASNTTAVGMYNVASTRTGPSRFGRMSMNMIRQGPAPRDLAASMYSFSLIDSVWPRTILEMPAQEKNEITAITIPRLGPSIAPTATPGTTTGNTNPVPINL